MKNVVKSTLNTRFPVQLERVKQPHTSSHKKAVCRRSNDFLIGVVNFRNLQCSTLGLHVQQVTPVVAYTNPETFKWMQYAIAWAVHIVVFFTLYS